jgi:hypothetical protein
MKSAAGNRELPTEYRELLSVRKSVTGNILSMKRLKVLPAVSCTRLCTKMVWWWVRSASM